jgi:DNA-directed RNA polymerase subunit RPC12/RpoP
LINQYKCPNCHGNINLDEINHINNELFEFNCPYCIHEILANNKYDIIKKLEIDYVDKFSNQDETKEIL